MADGARAELVRRLDALAAPLGHQVTADGDRLQVRPRGAVEHHSCQFVSDDPGAIEAYVIRRSGNLAWTLDVEDPRFVVEVAPGTVSVVLVDTVTESRHVVVGDILATHREDDGRGRVTLFRTARRSAPPVGRWYR